MGAANSNGNIVNKPYSNSVWFRCEEQLLLSTTYPLNASNTTRIRIGLRASGAGDHFKPVIELSGGPGEGIGFDFYCWTKFKGNMTTVGSYLRGYREEIPQDIIFGEIALNFTTPPYDSRSVMLSLRTSSPENNTRTVKSPNAGTVMSQSPMVQQAHHEPSILLQRSSFEGLENIVKCIDAKHRQLETIAENVSECARFLTAYIAYKLPKNVAVDEDLVRVTLSGNYREIEKQMRRQFGGGLEFVNATFDVVFSELTTIYFNHIAQTIIIRYFSV